MTFEHFHSSGKIPVLIEQLKITVRDSDRRSGQQRRSLADILSRPVALDLQSLSKSEQTIDEVVDFNSKLLLPVWQLRYSKYEQLFSSKGIFLAIFHNVFSWVMPEDRMSAVI